MKLLGKSWHYISEGNAHIVIHLKDTNYVIRLIKDGIKPVLSEDLKKALNFVNVAMVPLSKNYNYGVAELIDISNYNLDDLIKELEIYRPANRLYKSIISPFAIRTLNLSIVDAECKTNYCVEIKPKEGFICSSFKAYSKCYYCLKQYYKVYNQDVQEISAYCPLDLFSGDKRRMYLALQSIIDNAQNNFKMFKNGTLLDHCTIYGDGEGVDIDLPFQNKEVFIDFIIEVLLAEMPEMNKAIEVTGKEYQIFHKDSTKYLCNEYSSLKPNNILHNLLQLQKLSEFVTLRDSDICNTNNDYVNEVLKDIENMCLDLNSQKDRDIFLNKTDSIHLALISAIAKDCSIMISFSKDFIENMPYIDIQECNIKSRIYYKWAFTDLEPKPIETLLKRKNTEQKLIEIYKKHIGSLNKE